MKKRIYLLIFIVISILALSIIASAAEVTPQESELGDCIINGEKIDLPVTPSMSYTVLSEDDKTVTLSGNGGNTSGTIVIPSTILINGESYSVVKTNAAVFKGTSISKIYVPDTVETLGSMGGNDNGTFANCSNLSEVYIGTGIKVFERFSFTSIGKTSTVKVFYVAGRVQVLGEYAFNAANFASDCEITFDSSDMRRIEANVFDNSSKSLKKIDSDKLEYIGQRGFASCQSIEYILIPENCTIGMYAFNGTDNLQTAIIRCAENEIKEIPKEMFSSDNSGYKTNIYIKGKVVATEWAVLPGRVFNIYMDSYENAKYFVDSIKKFGHSNRVANGVWHFCTPYNGSYCFLSDGNFNLVAQAEVTEPTHVAIYQKGVLTNATCNQYAGIGDICEVCGAYFNVVQTGNEYDESAHNFVLKSHTDPQCIVTGLDLYECSYCGNTREEIIDVLGHDYESEIIAPSCTLNGYTSNVCTRCDYTIVTDIIDKSTHSYLTKDFKLDGINITYTTYCKYCGLIGEEKNESLVNKCFIDGYGVFDATLEYLNISNDGTVTPSDANFDDAVIYFPSYVEIDGTAVEVKTIKGFKEKSIKGLYIPDTVTTLEQSCFQNVYDLKNIVVGSGVTELKEYVFSMGGKTISIDEFVFKGTITRLEKHCLARINATSSDIPYEFDTYLSYIGEYVSLSDRTGGNILREVYITYDCDLSEKFAFNGSNGLKRAYIEGGDTFENAKELTQEMFSGDARGLEILIKGYVKATGQAVLPTNGALVFFKTMDQAKHFAASVCAQDYNDRGTKSGWYVCDDYSDSEARRYILDKYTTDPNEITFKRQNNNYFYHAGITNVIGGTCTQGGTISCICFMCDTTLENKAIEPNPHKYDGGVFIVTPICSVLGQIKYTCLDCGNEKIVETGYDLTKHNLDTNNGAELVSMIYESFLEYGKQYIRCSHCKDEIEGEILEPIFRNLGYSYSEVSGSVMQGFAVNNKALDIYQKGTGQTVNYGLVAALKSSVTSQELVDVNGNGVNERVIVAPFTNKTYDLFEIKIKNIGEEYRDKELYCCAYYIVNGKVTYLDASTEKGTVLTPITYNQIANG